MSKTKKSKSKSKKLDELPNIDELLATDDWDTILKYYKKPRDVIINGNNLLHFACIRGNEYAINYYLVKYPELIFVSNENGDTCVHLLAKYKWDDILKKVLTKYPEAIKLINNDGKSLMHLMITEPTIMNWLINSLPKEYFEEMTEEKVHTLSSMVELIKRNKGIDIYYETVKQLLAKGFQVTDGPVFAASSMNKPEILNLLIHNPGTGHAINLANIKDAGELTPIIYAVRNRAYDSVKVLLENGADINYGGPEGDELPINLAIQNNDNKMVEILLKNKKLNLGIKDRYLNTPLHYSLEYENNILPSNMLRLLYKGKKYLNLKNLEGVSPSRLLKRSQNLQYYGKLMNAGDLTSSGELSNSSESSEIMIKMPETLNKNYGLFNSDAIHNSMYTIYLMNKYKNLGVPHILESQEKETKNLEHLNKFNFFKTEEGQILGDLLNIYLDNFPYLAPHLILWNSSNLNYYDSKLKIYCKKLLQNPKIRFIYFKLTLIPNSVGTHANLIIFDKETKTAERFEPYGSHQMMEEQKLNKFLKSLLTGIFGNITYKSPKMYLEDTKFQVVSSDSDPNIRKMGDPAGYCLAWCFWYLELRLNNPNVDSETLVKVAFENIQKLSSKTVTSNNYIDYIRDYSATLDKAKNEIMKKAGVPESEFYNSTYEINSENNRLDKIADYLYKQFEKLV